MARKPNASPSASRPGSMRDSIKKVATELLIRHGFHGTSFRNIADRLDITTTNIHYHFGNKEKLVEEVTQDYVASTCERHARIWESSDTTLAEKLLEVLAFNHARYKAYNKGRKQGQSWSLIGRLRLDSDVVSPATRESLGSFTVSVHGSIRKAVALARDKNELRPDAPIEDIALLIVNIVNSSSVFTQDTGSFERLEEFFAAFSRVVLSAYAAD